MQPKAARTPSPAEAPPVQPEPTLARDVGPVEPPQPSYEPTSSPAPEPTFAGDTRPAPPRPAPRPRSPSATGPEAALSKRASVDDGRSLPHRGFVASVAVGTQGCIGTLCSASRHAARPGVRLDGFVGGNIRGWVELGFAGGWGTLDADVPEGTNAMSLYGLDPGRLQQTADLLGRPLDFDIASLRVEDTQLRMARVGPLMRVHFIPRGRVTAYVGSGVGYSMFRAQYDTAGGDLRVDLHGLDVPIQGGFAVHVHEHVAVGAQFDYLWTWYPLASLQHPAQSLTAPIEVLEAASPEGSNLQGDLPSFWTLTFGLRTRV